MNSPLNRSAQAGMGSGVEGRVPTAPGSRKSSPAVSPAAAASIPRAGDRIDIDAVFRQYAAAYMRANKCDLLPYRISYENGWFVFRSRHSSMRLQSVRAAQLHEMTQVLKARIASGTDAAEAAETRSGSVEDEGPVGKAETPHQSPDPLSQTVAPSTEEKE